MHESMLYKVNAEIEIKQDTEGFVRDQISEMEIDIID